MQNQVKMGVVGIENLNHQKQSLSFENEQLKAQIISLEQNYELKQGKHNTHTHTHTHSLSLLFSSLIDNLI